MYLHILDFDSAHRFFPKGYVLASIVGFIGTYHTNTEDTNTEDTNTEDEYWCV